MKIWKSVAMGKSIFSQNVLSYIYYQYQFKHLDFLRVLEEVVSEKSSKENGVSNPLRQKKLKIPHSLWSWKFHTYMELLKTFCNCWLSVIIKKKEPYPVWFILTWKMVLFLVTYLTEDCKFNFSVYQKRIRYLSTYICNFNFQNLASKSKHCMGYCSRSGIFALPRHFTWWHQK